MKNKIKEKKEIKERNHRINQFNLIEFMNE